MIADVQWFRRHNVMPNPGGLLDQPPQWVEAVAVVDNEISALEQWGRTRGKGK